MKKITTLLLLMIMVVAISHIAWATNLNWAGKNKTIAPGGKVLIGMLPSDTFFYYSAHLTNQMNCNYQSGQFGCIACIDPGFPPTSFYKIDSFKWTPNINLNYIEKHFMPHALASPTVTTTYKVTIYLKGGTIQHDSVTVTVNTAASNPVFTIPNNYIIQCPFDTIAFKTHFKHDFHYSINGGVGNPKNYQYKLFDVYVDSSFILGHKNSPMFNSSVMPKLLKLNISVDSIHVGFTKDTILYVYDYNDDYYAVIEATDSAGITNAATITIHFQPTVGCDYIPKPIHYYTHTNTPFLLNPQPVGNSWMEDTYSESHFLEFNYSSNRHVIGLIGTANRNSCSSATICYWPKAQQQYIDTAWMIQYPTYSSYNNPLPPHRFTNYYNPNCSGGYGCQFDEGLFSSYKFIPIIIHVNDTIPSFLSDTAVCAGDSINIKPFINKFLYNYANISGSANANLDLVVMVGTKKYYDEYPSVNNPIGISTNPVLVPINKDEDIIFIFDKYEFNPVHNGCKDPMVYTNSQNVRNNLGTYFADTMHITATHCVWPGDADDNGVADLQDLFPIGLGNGITGLARTNASITWQAQDVNNWSGASFGTPNWKYADCDGNGTINGTDTLAIIQNFSLTHPRLATEKHKSGLPPLAIKIQPSIFNASTQQLQATISLGNTALPMDSVYGITFAFHFDANYIDTSKITYSVLNSWLFANANDHFWLNHHQLQNGVMNFALVRNNQLGKAGFGDIMQINLPLSSSLTSQPDLSQFITSLSNVKVINQIGSEIAVSVVTDSSLYSVLLSANEISNKTNELTVYPSPCKDKLTVSSNQFAVNTIEVTDVLGQLQHCSITQYSIHNTDNYQLNTANLSSGTYFIKATDTKGNVWNGKFVKE
ncbi:MAG: hypothetical protein RIQ33_98 [Bacteroidota bacterium]|jgi:hypothetical protein